MKKEVFQSVKYPTEMKKKLGNEPIAPNRWLHLKVKAKMEQTKKTMPRYLMRQKPKSPEYLSVKKMNAAVRPIGNDH
jgi:hypothetical protein